MNLFCNINFTSEYSLRKWKEEKVVRKHPWLFENVDTKKCIGTYIPQYSHDKKQLNIME